MTGYPSRRSALGAAALSPASLAALANGLALPAQAATAPTNVVSDYVRVRTNLDGRPTWWLSRGTRYLLADSQMTPLHANAMASCVVADRKDDGSYVVRTLEGSFSTDLETGALIDGFTNPASGKRVTLTPAAPVVVAYHYHADGRMTLPVGELAKPGAELRGALASRQPFAGGIAIEERFTIKTRTATTTSDLSEQIVFAAKAGTGGSATDVTKSVVVFRNWPYDRDQPQLTLLAIYQGRRFETFEGLMAEIGEGKLNAAQPGFAERLAAYR